MKKSFKIILGVLILAAGITVSGFYYEYPDKHDSSVFLDRMNVFYIGVDNPISISACGIAPSELRPTIAGGTILRSNPQRPGGFIVRVSGGTEATLTVGIERDSLFKSLGSYKFRIKRIPDPVIYLGNGKGNANMTKAELLGMSGLFAKMENFDFDVHFTIVSFTLSTLSDGKWKISKSNAPLITPEMKTDLQSVKADDKVIFGDVTVQGPDGTLRRIPGVVVTVK